MSNGPGNLAWGILIGMFLMFFFFMANGEPHHKIVDHQCAYYDNNTSNFTWKYPNRKQ